MLKATIEKMKELMVLSKDALTEATEKYYQAIETFDNLNSSIQLQNRLLKNFSETASENVNSLSFKLSNFPEPELFLFSDFNLYFSSYWMEKVAKLEADIEETFASAQKIDEILKEGIAFLNEEIEVLGRWSNGVDTVSKNIDQYPQEYLRKIKVIRTTFINALTDLQNTATEFLNRGELFEKEQDDSTTPGN